jgi:hypothetical protein
VYHPGGTRICSATVACVGVATHSPWWMQKEKHSSHRSCPWSLVRWPMWQAPSLQWPTAVACPTEALCSAAGLSKASKPFMRLWQCERPAAASAVATLVTRSLQLPPECLCWNGWTLRLMQATGCLESLRRSLLRLHCYCCQYCKPFSGLLIIVPVVSEVNKSSGPNVAYPTHRVLLWRFDNGTLSTRMLRYMDTSNQLCHIGFAKCLRFGDGDCDSLVDGMHYRLPG